MSEVTIDEAALRERIEAVLKEKMKEMGLLGENWVVVADAPYAAYVEFGTRPADPKNKGPMSTKNPKITEVRQRFREWAVSKGRTEAWGDLVYKKVMEEGASPNPYMRPALYRTLDSLYIEDEWDQYPPSLEDVANRIAETAKHYVMVYDMGLSGSDEVKKGGLAESIRAMPASECTVEGTQDPAYNDKRLWSKERMNEGILGKTARLPR